MENEKSQREKSAAALSLGLLAVAVSLVLFTAAGTIATKGRFELILRELMTPDKIPAITQFFIFTPTINFVIFFGLLILILILKEIFVHTKKITLIINAVTAIAAIACIPVYVLALYLPIAGNREGAN